MPGSCFLDTRKNNSANRAEVEGIAERLRDEHGLRVFFDAWEIVPGDLVVGALEEAIDRSRTARARQRDRRRA
jgi:hypothetical protein